MLSSLPTIVNTAALAHADPAGAAGMAPRDSAEVGHGFAALMQQQTDLRLADQRRSEQRSSEPRLAGQRQTEPSAAASSAPPPAAARQPAARPAEASRLERQRAERNATAEAAAQDDPRGDAQPSTDAPTAAGAPASQPASSRRAGADDTASAVAGSARRRRAAEAEAEAAAVAVADDHARATTTVGAANLARARSAAHPVQRLADAPGAAPVAPLPAAALAGDAGVAGPTPADVTATDVASEAPGPAATPVPTVPHAAAPDASALQSWLQAQAMVTGWQPASGLEAQAQVAGAGAGADAARPTLPVAALPDRSLRRTDALTTTGLASLSTANGESPVVPRTLPGAEPEAAPVRTEAHHRSAGPALATGPMTAGLPTATDDTRVAGRTARRAAAVEIARTPADTARPLATTHTPAAQAAEATLASAPASPARPSTVASAASSDPTEGIEPAAFIASSAAPASEAAGAVDAAAAAAAALVTPTIAPAPRTTAAATPASPATAHGTAAAPAVTLATLALQLRAGGPGSSAAGAERVRNGDSTGTRHSGPAGSARPDGNEAAARHPDAPDLRLAGNPSTDPLARGATAEEARPGTEAASNDLGVTTGSAPDTRPAEPTGVLIPAATGARPDHQAASTQADQLRVAEAGPAQANPSAQVPAATAAPASSTTAAGTLPAAAGPVHEARIPVPLDSPAFAPALGSQISLFAREGVQTARLQLNPAEMGPISVQIALDGNAARVDFQADLAGTREVIEASLPALAGALQDAGLTLAGGGVFQQTPGRQGQGDAASAAAPRHGAGRDGTTDADVLAPAPVVRERRGLVDLVA